MVSRDCGLGQTGVGLGTSKQSRRTRIYNWQKKRSRYCGVPSKLYREKNLLAAKEKHT